MRANQVPWGSHVMGNWRLDWWWMWWLPWQQKKGRDREREREREKRQAWLESIDGVGGRQSAATGQSYATV